MSKLYEAIREAQNAAFDSLPTPKHTPPMPKVAPPRGTAEATAPLAAGEQSAFTATDKPSNPKDIVGQTKLDVSIVPFTVVVCAARALLEGALKYGRFNWRMVGVRASIYISAFHRHIAKWEHGQNYDKKSKVHHLDNAIACLTIIRDAELYGKLVDDRAPCPNPDAMADLIDGCTDIVAHLKGEFAAHSPYQYTIADTPPSIQGPA